MSGIKEMTPLPSVISWQINVVLGTEMTWSPNLSVDQ